MRLVEIKQIRKVMSALLLGKEFDRFLLMEASVITFHSFQIDGRIHPEYYEDGEISSVSYSPWKKLKPICYELVKGKYLPLKLKLVFCLSEEGIRKLLERNGFGKEVGDITGLSFVIRYEKNPETPGNEDARLPEMSMVTGISRKSFTLDKSVECFWDDTMEKFLHRVEEQ